VTKTIGFANFAEAPFRRDQEGSIFPREIDGSAGFCRHVFYVTTALWDHLGAEAHDHIPTTGRARVAGDRPYR